jgi:hypothetical protein
MKNRICNPSANLLISDRLSIDTASINEDLSARASIKKNISCEILRNKQIGLDDPLNNVGIMTLNNISLPYKKPILKRTPGIYVNARGVINELDKDYGGIKDIRSSSLLHSNNS